MSALQKKLLLACAVLLLLQALADLTKYFIELAHGGHFGGDFIGFWHAAQLTVQGHIHAVYDTDALIPVYDSQDARSYAVGLFPYPPYMLLVLWPLGGLTYNQAVVIWSLIPLILYYVVLIRILQNSALKHEDASSRMKAYVIIIACVVPFLSANLFTGQSAAWIGTLFLAAFLFWPGRPVLAGICIGLIAVKPQFGLLFPLALIASRQWRIVMAAAVTVMVMVVVATLWFGVEVWSDYLHMTQSFGQQLKDGDPFYDKLALSPYISLRPLGDLGLPGIIAASVQLGITLAVMVIIFRIFRHPDAPQDLRFGLLASGALLSTPYAMSYDSPLLGMAMASLLVCVWRTGFDNFLEIMVFTAILVMPFAQALLLPWHVPFSALALLAFFMVLYRRYSIDSPSQSVRNRLWQ